MTKASSTLQGRPLNVVPDSQDLRDWVYRPSLMAVPDRLDPPAGLRVLDQESEGACTGFGLAAVLNLLDHRRQRNLDAAARGPVSPRMLYEMARKFDEWPGEDYPGSSCRGAVRGWQNMGVCRDADWPFKSQSRGWLTLDRARAARANKPGAYYRLQPRISDYHDALNSTGAIFASASVHDGWENVDDGPGVISFVCETRGAHAFAIVGYNDRGFWVQNSWGKDWGQCGLALWTYEDWQENILDAWVVQFAASTPEFYAGNQASTARGPVQFFHPRTRRETIAGHFVHIDDGEFHDSGRYHSSIRDVNETARYLEGPTHYKHLLLYAHGGFNSPAASADRIAAMKTVFKKNHIYPFHFMYDTGLMEELKDVVLRRDSDTSRAAGIGDLWDRGIERLMRVPGRALWREMKHGATSPFLGSGAGTRTLKSLLKDLPSHIKVHLVGHSTGAILIAHLLDRLGKAGLIPRISTCSLMAPAVTVEDFKRYYAPLATAPRARFGINEMRVYNLSDRLERDDTVAGIYRKSLLYLVSNACEERRGTPLLGMDRYTEGLGASVEFIVSEGPGGGEPRSQSLGHADFDEDPATMNAILRDVLELGENPPIHFTTQSLKY